jgi:hypothetical protein
MTITATRAPARDLSPTRKAYANRVEEATGWTIAWRYCTEGQAWAFYLLDPYGKESYPFHCWDDLTDFCQDEVDEYEDQFSDAEGGL